MKKTVEIPEVLFNHLLAFSEKVLEKETLQLFPTKYMHIDKEGNKVKRTKNNSKDVVQTMDVEKTAMVEESFYRTELGQDALHTILDLMRFKTPEEE